MSEKFGGSSEGCGRAQNECEKWVFDRTVTRVGRTHSCVAYTGTVPRTSGRSKRETTGRSHVALDDELRDRAETVCGRSDGAQRFEGRVELLARLAFRLVQS